MQAMDISRGPLVEVHSKTVHRIHAEIDSYAAEDKTSRTSQALEVLYRMHVQAHSLAHHNRSR